MTFNAHECNSADHIKGWWLSIEWDKEKFCETTVSSDSQKTFIMFKNYVRMHLQIERMHDFKKAK